MKYTLIFESVTYAIKARKTLLHNGINVKSVKRISGNDAGVGCVYSLDVFDCNPLDLARYLRMSDIPYKLYP